MSDFAIAYQYLMGWEDDPHNPGVVTTDDGGRTRLGISEHAHPEVSGQNFYTCPLQQATAVAQQIYLASYWTPLHASVFSQPLANRLFDCGVNDGITPAGQVLQKSLAALGAHLKIDGRIGPETIMLVGAAELNELLAAFRAQRWEYYLAIMASHPDWKRYSRDWYRRAMA